MTKKTISDFEALHASPFQKEGIVPITYTPKKENVFSFVTDDGVRRSAAFLPEQVKGVKDTLSYTKLFHKNARRLVQLSPSALKLVIYISVVIKPKADIVELDVDDVLDFCGWTSKPMYYRAIVDLLEANVLARRAGKSPIFFVDVNLLFNGDRVKDVMLERSNYEAKEQEYKDELQSAGKDFDNI